MSDNLGFVSDDDIGFTSDDPTTIAAKKGWEAARPHVGRALDYTGGIARTAALFGPAQLAEAITGKDISKPKEDFERAFSINGEAPMPSEYLNRGGITNKWATVPADVVGSVLLDPPVIGWASKISKAPKLLKYVASPVAETTKDLGKWGWKNAFKSLDVEATKQGKKIMPSKILTDAGVASWTARGINDKMAGVAEEFLNARNQILEAATDAGGKINNNIAERHARELAAKYRKMGTDQTDAVADAIEREIGGIQRLRPAPAIPPRIETSTVKSPILDQFANPIEKEVSRTIPGVPARPGTSPSRATDIKTFFAKGVPSSNWAPYVSTPLNSELDKAMATGLKEAAEDSVSTTLGKSTGSKFEDINEKLGSLLSTRKKEIGEVGKEEMKDLFTSVDGLTLSALLASESSPKWMLIKKAADLAKMQGVRSMAGKYGTKLGNSLLPNSMAGQFSAWSLRDDKPKDTDFGFQQ